MIKKLLALLLAAIALCMCGCQKDAHEEKPAGAPQLIGLIYEQIVSDPAYAGYTLEKSEQYNDKVDAGVIADQSPRAGQAMRNNVIRVVVSKGARYPSTTAQAVMTKRLPQVTDDYLEDAINELKAKGFSVDLEQVVYVNSDKYYRGIVVAQDPPAGSYASTDTPVVLTVSSGFVDTTIKVPFPSVDRTIDLRIIVDGDLQTAEGLGVPLTNLYLPDLTGFSFVTKVQKERYTVEIQYAESGGTQFKEYARYTVHGDSGEVIQNKLATIA
ncbi:MAG: PASTA domain-containing protein [Acutalibacteraceae bacterium]